jgi:hypothetical protein
MGDIYYAVERKTMRKSETATVNMVAAISDKTLKKAVEDVEYNVVGINREQFKIPRFLITP